jgi:hypothetical protein
VAPKQHVDHEGPTLVLKQDADPNQEVGGAQIG